MQTGSSLQQLQKACFDASQDTAVMPRRLKAALPTSGTEFNGMWGQSVNKLHATLRTKPVAIVDAPRDPE